MPLTKVVPRPGLNKEATNYSNEGQWWDSDKVRFRSSKPEKIGGWVQVTSKSFTGVCRALWNWVTLQNENTVAIGTHNHLYIEYGEAIYDVTPLRATATLSNALSTTTGVAQVNVTHTSHSAVTGDYVTISGVAAALNGIPAAQVNGDHEVVVLGPNSYYFLTTTTATATSTPTTTNIVFKYLISSGNATANPGNGWGAGTWGRLTWGSPAPSNLVTSLRIWRFSNYGEDLVASLRDGGIYWFFGANVSTASRAVNLTTLAPAAPVVAASVLVTEDRHVVAYGANAIGTTLQDPMLVRWAAQEDYTDWTPTSTNTAGDYKLSYGSRIIAADRTRQETLVFTDSAVYSQQFLGPPYTFGFNLLSPSVSIVSPNAVVTVNNTTYWMGTDKFYGYNGRVDTLPCSVRGHVFSDFSQTQAFQTFGGSNERFNEVWWFYCSSNALYPDRYVVYNYVENIWYIGTMNRTAWLDSSMRAHPMAVDTGNHLLYHEVGLDDNSTGVAQPILSYIESADMDIADGDQFSFIRRLIPDVAFDGSTGVPSTVNFTVTVRNTPGGAYTKTTASPISRSATVPVERYTEQAWIRLRGRQLALRIESSGVGVAWQLGAPRIEIQADGRRS